MSKSPTTDSESTMVCACDELVRSSCRGEPSYEDDDRHYCVFHFPNPGKSEDFKKALKQKLENQDFDFIGVYFPPEVSFAKFNFSQTANFTDATFLGGADFHRAVFSNGATISAQAAVLLETILGPVQAALLALAIRRKFMR